MRLPLVALLLALLALLALLVPLAGCSGSSDLPGVSFTRSTLQYANAGGATGDIRVELALTPEQLTRGLGYRDSLARDAGMLFDLGATQSAAFWMKGMRFPLDMVWITEDRRVVSVTAGVPAQPGVPDEQLERYSPGVPVRYVLELNAGAAARLGIAPGTQLTFTIAPAG